MPSVSYGTQPMRVQLSPPPHNEPASVTRGLSPGWAPDETDQSSPVTGSPYPSEPPPPYRANSYPSETPPPYAANTFPSEPPPPYPG